MNQRFIRIVLGLCVTLPFVLHMLHMPRLAVLDQIDQKIADIRMRLDNEFRSFKTDPVKKAVVDSIVILDIDESSLASLGRWPWSRDKLAQIMDLLFDKYQIGVLGFDVVFAEPDTSSGLNTLKALERGPLKDSPGFAASLQQLAPSLDFDARFAESIRGRNVVMGAYLSSNKGASKSGTLSEPPTPEIGFPKLGVNWYEWSGHGGNLPNLAAAAASTAIFNTVVDSDGIVRRTPAVFKYQGGYYEALSVAVLRSMLNAPPAMPGATAGGALAQSAGYLNIEWMTIKASGQRPLRIPVDSEASMLIPYRGNGGPDGGTFKYISLADVASGKTPLADLKGKITLVGTCTGPGGPALHTRGSHLPRRRNSCQPDFRHVAARSEGAASLCGRCRAGSAADHQLHPDLRAAVPVTAAGYQPVCWCGADHHRDQLHGLHQWCDATYGQRPSGGTDGVHHGHGLRLFRRKSQQTPVRQPVWPICTPRTGQRNGSRSDGLQHGA
jgi:adenylate cyclase